MKKTVEIEVITKSKDYDISGGLCDTCKYHDDPEYVCRIRQCVHAVSCLYDLYEAEVENG